tara:strand:+ start:6874 stop:7398 length:525 start_codon:yes stop_codon:yes gene_type:complete
MNIFALHEDPDIAARLLYDQHVRSKMIVESAQMLANCFTSAQLETAPLTQRGTPRKHSYFNHPCSKWVRESFWNMKWLCRHASAMHDERSKRFGSAEPHFSLTFINWASCNIGKSVVPLVSKTPFAIAINENCECRKFPGFDCLDIIEKYRLYYELDKPYMTRTQPSVDSAVYI